MDDFICSKCKNPGIKVKHETICVACRNEKAREAYHEEKRKGVANDTMIDSKDKAMWDIANAKW